MYYVGILINFIICFGIPIGGFIFFHKKYHIKFRTFFIGILAFTISQICIRIPLLQLVCPGLDWFKRLITNPVLYGIFLGGTAGIAEEFARLIGMKFCIGKEARLNKIEENAIVFGLGHGGIEAVLLIGMPLLFSAICTAIFGLDVSQSEGGILLVTFERVYAIAFHVGASLIIMYGIKRNKGLLFTLLAVLFHTILDAAIVILPAVFGAGGTVLTLYGAFMGFVTLAMGIALFHYSKKDKEQVVMQMNA